MIHRTILAAALLAPLLLACSRAQGPGPAPLEVTQVEVEGPPPPARSPGPQLGDPPPVSLEQFGASYLQQVQSPLQARWAGFLQDIRGRLPAADPLRDESLAVTLAIELDRRGELAALAVVRSSGIPDFDTVAAEVVRDAAPLPLPPAGLISDDDRVHLQWTFHNDRRGAGAATATLTRELLPVAEAVAKYLAAGDVSTAATRLLDDRSTAPQARADLGERIFEAAVRAALASDDPAARAAGVAAASAGKVAAAAPQVRALVAGTADPMLVREALLALGALADAEAAPLLREVLVRDRGQTESGVAAAHALAELGEAGPVTTEVMDWLASSEPSARMGALMVLAELPVEGAVQRVAPLTKDSERRQRSAACAALAGQVGLHGDAVKFIRVMLDDADPAVRAACAEALAVAAARGVKSRLGYWKAIELLKDRDERVRAAALRAAAALAPAQLGKSLAMVAREQSPVVLRALAESLARVPGPTAVERLVALLEHEDGEVRLRAAESLRRRAEPAAAAALIAHINDDDVEVRARAVRATRDPEQLQGHLDDPEAMVRQAALAALIEQRGKHQALDRTLRELLETPSASAERARIAQAWLAAG